MTHSTDCTVLDEHLGDVEDIAEEFRNGNKGKAHDMTEDLGWNFIGGGAGRRVYRVSGEHQIGDVEQATHEAPCVVKFASGRGQHSGLRQNSLEVSQSQSIPEELTEGEDPPVFVPVKDWADDHSWLSMPEVDAAHGVVAEVERRLAESGWVCDDMHSDNVGAMHETSVVLDYGLDCAEAATPLELAEELVDELQRVDVVDAEVEEHYESASATFFQPRHVLPELPDAELPSSIYVGDMGGVASMKLNFGPYDPEYHNTGDVSLYEIAGDVASEAGWLGTHIRPDIVDGPDDEDIYVKFDVEVEARGVDERMTADIAADLYDDLADEVNRQMPGGEEGPKLPTPADPEVGMVIDHPMYDTTLSIREVNEGGNVLRVEDANGTQYTLSGGNAKITDDMVVKLPKTTIDTAQQTITQAIEAELADEGVQDDDRERIREEVEEAMSESLAAVRND